MTEHMVTITTFLYSKYYFIFSVHTLLDVLIMSTLTWWFMINDIKPLFSRDLSSVVKELIVFLKNRRTTSHL